VRTPYDQDLAGREAVFSISAGRLPFGLQLEPDGRLHGVPIAVQHADFTVSATSGSKTEDREFSWTVTDADGMRLLVEELPVAWPGQAYSHQLSAVGGDPANWSIVRGRTFFAGAGDPEGPMPNDDQVPPWLTLDSSTGVLSGTPDAQEAVILLLIEASGTAQETYALRVGDPAQDGWLLAKSEGFVARLLEVHVPSGLHLAREADGCYSNYGDSCCWSGTAMAGLAFRAAVLQTDAAAEKVSILLEGLRTLRLITGVEGLPGRSYEHRENIDGACGQWHLDTGHPEQYEGTGDYSTYRYWTETSRDQFTGNIWGHTVVHEVFPLRSDLRALAAENIVAMAAHVWDNQMKIVDKDGKVTNYGTMSGYGFDGLDPYELGTQLDNGMNAIMLLNWFQLASQLAPDQETRQVFAKRLNDLIADRRNPAEGREFERNYLDLLEKNYAYSAYPAGAADYYTDTSWYNVHMAFSTFFHLVRRAGDPELRRRTLEAFRTVLWDDAEPMASGCEKPTMRRARREWNPHYSWQYLAALGDRDAEAIFECLSMLMWFVNPPRRDYLVENPLGVETVPGHPDFACEAVPIHLRPPSSNYIWHREPYRHTGGMDTPGREDGGSDGFVPYWMGRYFGFVPSNI
jgi:hypothetical protein